MASSSDPAFTPDEERILDARTAALAAPAEAATVTQGGRLVVHVAGEAFALATRSVRAISRLVRLCPVPYAPAHVAGLMVHDGVVLPVFHLRFVLAVAGTALPELAHVLLVGDGSSACALLVDAAVTFAEAAAADGAEELRPLPPSVAAAARPFLLGVQRDGIPVLDVDALLASPLLVVDVPPPFDLRGDAP